MPISEIENIQLILKLQYFMLVQNLFARQCLDIVSNY
jgi:hypothetical protein